jgi:acetyl-CoA carboxylase biotin carboxyl carrier protein
LDLNQLKQILDLVRAHELSEFEIEHDGLRLKLRTHAGVAAGAAHAAAPSVQASAAPASAPTSPTAPTAAAAAHASAAPVVDAEVELAVVKSPIVGTFYRSPEPTAASFVEVGSAVKKGQVLCIIEAMKLMNEIDSEYDGEIANIYVENGQPVQYGERLFAIRTK